MIGNFIMVLWVCLVFYLPSRGEGFKKTVILVLFVGQGFSLASFVGWWILGWE